MGDKSKACVTNFKKCAAPNMRCPTSIDNERKKLGTHSGNMLYALNLALYQLPLQ